MAKSMQELTCSEKGATHPIVRERKKRLYRQLKTQKKRIFVTTLIHRTRHMTYDFYAS